MSLSLENDLDMLGMDDDCQERPQVIITTTTNKQKGEAKMYNSSMVRPSMTRALQDYVDNGSPKGGFLIAVLCNDLFGAAGKADDDNFETLAHVVGWCYNNVPSIARGSRDAYDRWCNAHLQVRTKKGYGNYTIDEVYAEINEMEDENERAKRA